MVIGYKLISCAVKEKYEAVLAEDKLTFQHLKHKVKCVLSLLLPSLFPLPSLSPSSFSPSLPHFINDFLFTGISCSTVATDI